MKDKLITLFSNEKRTFLLWGIVVFFAALLIGVMAIPPDISIFMYLTGEKSKLELIKLIGWGISGLIAILGVRGLLQRASALEEQNKITREGHRHERIKTANERLGSEHASVRISAFNDFHYLASIEPDLRRSIFNILCAHLRQTTKDKNYQPDKRQSENMGEKIKPTEEVQSLLSVLFKPDKLDNKDNFIFDGLVANLEEVNLQGANMRHAILREANLQKANLQNAELFGANLSETDFYDAKLQKANMIGVDLCNAYLLGAELQGACMLHAEMYGANLEYSKLQGAELNHARINKETKMPHNWENIVKRNNDGKTGVIEED